MTRSQIQRRIAWSIPIAALIGGTLLIPLHMQAAFAVLVIGVGTAIAAAAGEAGMRIEPPAVAAIVGVVFAPRWGKVLQSALSGAWPPPSGELAAALFGVGLAVFCTVAFTLARSASRDHASVAPPLLD